MSLKITPTGTYGKKPPRIARYLMKKTNLFFFQLIGKRIKVGGRPVLLLITVGSKTGKIRKTPLGWFPDSEKSWFVVASNGGASGHPSWFINLAKNPNKVSIKLSDKFIEVLPEILENNEREIAWNHVIKESPQYSKYSKYTDRIIPVIRLTTKE